MTALNGSDAGDKTIPRWAVSSLAALCLFAAVAGVIVWNAAMNQPTPAQAQKLATMRKMLDAAPRDALIEYDGGKLAQVIRVEPRAYMFRTRLAPGQNHFDVSTVLEHVERVIPPDAAEYEAKYKQFLE